MITQQKLKQKDEKKLNTTIEKINENPFQKGFMFWDKKIICGPRDSLMVPRYIIK